MAAAIERFDFHGDTLDVVRLDDGDVGAVLARLCDVFDLNVQAQSRKLAELPWACVAKIATQVGGQSREVLVLHRRSLAGWLFTLNAGKVRPELRDKLATYQREAADVLADHFLGRRGQSLAHADQIGAALVTLASNTAALTTMVSSVVKRLDDLESRASKPSDDTIGTAGAKRIKAAVRLIVETHTAAVPASERASAGRSFRSAEYASLRQHLDQGMRPRLDLLPANLLRPALNFLDGRLADARRSATVAASGRQTELPLNNVSPIQLAPDAA